MDRPLVRWWQSSAPAGPEELKLASCSQWRRHRQDKRIENEHLLDYITDLLPRDLARAEADGRIQVAEPCDTLLFLLGYSVEPLLQALAVFQPRQVILLYAPQYNQHEGLVRAGQVQEWVETLFYPQVSKWVPQWVARQTKAEKPAPEIPPVVLQPTITLRPLGETRNAVFDTLRALTLEWQNQPAAPPPQQIVIDITGGKKSMDAQAFLFAAYHGIAVSYIDFDHYDEETRRPYGYSCRILPTLPNPYRDYALHEWEQVRRLYRQYHFDQAAQVLADIRKIAQPLTPEISQAIDKVECILGLYLAWDTGAYEVAYDQLAALQARIPEFTPPCAVLELGGYCRANLPPLPAEAGLGGQVEALLQTYTFLYQQGGLFNQPKLLLTYARDELAKIERLIKFKEDHRAALLRAAGLDEFLLKARLVRAWDQGQLKYSSGDHPSDDFIREELLRFTGTKWMHLALAPQRKDGTRNGLRLNFLRDNSQPKDQGFYHHGEYDGDPKTQDSAATWLAYKPERPFLPEYWRDQAGHPPRLYPKEITALRNQAIHMSLSVPRGIAEAAWETTKANVENLRLCWLGAYGRGAPEFDAPDTQALRWSDLCRLCGLSFLPPRLQRD